MANGPARPARGPLGPDRAGPLRAASGHGLLGPDHTGLRAATSAHGPVRGSF
jgi:hypothetical protein